MPIFSIIIGLLLTIVTWSFDVQKILVEKKKGDIVSKRQEPNTETNSARVNFSIKYKGANKMSLVIVTFLVGVGICGRDSKKCVDMRTRKYNDI